MHVSGLLPYFLLIGIKQKILLYVFLELSLIGVVRTNPTAWK
uniref:Uncharacterized protein n=1 Tax=Setaria italica TaxID=4555 RepID=K3XTR4_SETIT